MGLFDELSSLFATDSNSQMSRELLDKVSIATIFNLKYLRDLCIYCIYYSTTLKLKGCCRIYKNEQIQCLKLVIHSFKVGEYY